MARTLLYVDPDPATRRLVRKSLEPAGYLVLEAESPAQGGASAARVRPDVILVDVDQLAAGETLAPLRQWRRLEHVPVLAATARVWPREPERFSAQFDRVLMKPLDIDALPGQLAGSLSPLSEGVEDLDTPSETAPPLDERPAGEPSSAAGVEAAQLPALWRLNLGPVTDRFVRSIPATHGMLALFDTTGDALTVVAAASLRPPRDAAVLARIPLSAAPWLSPVLDTRQPIVLAVDGIGSSPLIPPPSNTILVVPVATADRLRGVAVLGEPRNANVAPFPPTTIARSMAEVCRLASVVEAVTMLDASIRQKREAIDLVRREVTGGLLWHVKERLEGREPHEPETGRGRRARSDAASGPDTMTWLAFYIAGRVGFPASERSRLCQALEVLEIGRTWLEEMLLPRTGIAEGDRAAFLKTAGDYSAEIARELDWPAPALELVRTHQAWWNGEGHPAGLAGTGIPLGARIIGAVAAYRRLVAGSSPDDAQVTSRAIAALESESGTRFDPAVIGALIERVGG